MPRKSDFFRFFHGYWPVQSLTGSDLIPSFYGGSQHSVLDGLNAWIRASRVETALGPNSPGSSGNVGALIPVLQNVANSYGGLTGSGSIALYFNLYLYAGTGTAYAPGLSGGAVVGGTVTEVPQAGGVPVRVGIDPPATAPTIVDQPLVTGKNAGSYSILLTGIRNASNEESNRSPVSNIITCSNSAPAISAFPAVPTGADRWGIYCSHANFGALGPWFFLRSIPVSTGTPYTITLDNSTPGWFDGDLGVQAPLANFPPAPCTFVFTVGNIVVAAGGYGGNALSPTIPGNLGAFNPNYVLFLPGGGAITACKTTGIDGYVIVATANSLYGVTATYNSTTSPIDVQVIWPDVGFASGNNFTWVEGEIYGFTGQRGAVRSQGSGPPTTVFAAPVAEQFAIRGFTINNTVVVYDPGTDCILYCSGTTCLPYDRKYQQWHTPQTIASITSGVTSQGIGLLESSGGALQQLEAGSGSTGFITTPFRDADVSGWQKTICRFRAIGNDTFTFDLLTDPGNPGSSSLNIPSLNCDPKSLWQKINVRNVESLAIKASWTNLSRRSLSEMVIDTVPHKVATG